MNNVTVFKPSRTVAILIAALLACHIGITYAKNVTTEALNSQISSTKAIAETATSDLADLETSLVCLNKISESLDKDSQKAESTLAGAIKEVHSLEAEVPLLSRDLSIKQHELQEAEEKYSTASSKYNLAVAKQARLSDCSDKSLLDKIACGLSNAAKAGIELVLDSKNEMKNAQIELQQKQSALDSITKQVDDTNLKLKSAETKRKNEKAEIASITNKIESVKKERSTILVLLPKIKAIINSAKDELSDAKNPINESERRSRVLRKLISIENQLKEIGKNKEAIFSDVDYSLSPSWRGRCLAQ